MCSIFCRRFNGRRWGDAQLGQMSSIQIPHPDPNSLAQLLGHKLAKKGKAPETTMKFILCWGVEAFFFFKMIAVKFNGQRSKRSDVGLGSFVWVLNSNSTCCFSTNTGLKTKALTHTDITSNTFLFYFLQHTAEPALANVRGDRPSSETIETPGTQNND